MARAKGTIAGFGDVAGNNDNVNGSVDVNSNSNSNSNVNVLDLINEPEKKVQVGIYFDLDVAEALRRLADKGKGQKGLQSKIVNEALKKFLQDNGLM